MLTNRYALIFLHVMHTLHLKIYFTQYYRIMSNKMKKKQMTVLLPSTQSVNIISELIAK